MPTPLFARTLRIYTILKSAITCLPAVLIYLFATCRFYKNTLKSAKASYLPKIHQQRCHLFNMKAFRDKHFVDKFYYLMGKYHFDNVDPDQAYMNEICEDKIYHLPKEWDAMPNESIPEIEILRSCTTTCSSSHGTSKTCNTLTTSGTLPRPRLTMTN